MGGPGCARGPRAELSGIDFLRAIRDGEVPTAPISQLLGFHLVEVDEGRAVFSALPGEGTVLHRGSRIATADGRLTRAADGKLLAHGTSTCMIFKLD